MQTIKSTIAILQFSLLQWVIYCLTVLTSCVKYYPADIWEPRLALALFMALVPSFVLMVSACVLKIYIRNVEWEWDHDRARTFVRLDMRLVRL